MSSAEAVSTVEAGVPAAETTGMSAAGVTSAMLRPDGDGQEERERRENRQTTHTRLL
jgi:hypothetical protein